MSNKWSKKQKDQYNKQHYLNNKDSYLQRKQTRRKEMQEWWKQFKSTLKCERCPESHPACLDFHHTDPNIKHGNIGSMVSAGSWGKTRILQEVEKCIVLCSNCHRKEHFAL
jgi:L-lactate utilization protein LutB